MKTSFAITFVLALLLSSQADAKVRHHRMHVATGTLAHPDCNVLWPCIGVTPAPYGVKAVQQMGFGTPQQRYTHPRSNSRVQGVVSRRDAGRYAAGYANVSVVGGRPDGCPRQYCGCWTSLKAFGRIIPFYNLAANWYTLPRAIPGPGMVEVVHRHHVRYILADMGGGLYKFSDGNSGGHLTREHIGPIRGVVVNPNSGMVSGTEGYRHYANRGHRHYAHHRRNHYASR